MAPEDPTTRNPAPNRNTRRRRHPARRARAGAAAAGGIGLINSIGNLGGFAAPYATGALDQWTGSSRAGMWAVGVIMVLAAALVVVLRATPDPDARAGGTLGPNPPVNRSSV